MSPTELGMSLFFAAMGAWGCIADNAKIPPRYRSMCAAALFLGGAMLKTFLVRHGIN